MRWRCACDRIEDVPGLARMAFSRNPGLAARIEEEHARGFPIFAAVGLMHTVGDTGIPNLLAARGFKVERVRNDARP